MKNITLTKDGVIRVGTSVVEVLPCFPWQHPDKFLSFRDSEGQELAFLDDLKTVGAELAAAIQKELYRKSFVFKVTKILKIEDLTELRRYQVETENGPRTFMTNEEDWPFEVARGEYRLVDLSGDIYHMGALDPKSLEILRPYID